MDEGDLLELNIKSASVELSIKWSDRLNKPIVQSYKVTVNKSPLAVIGCSLDGANTWLTDIHPNHPFLKTTPGLKTRIHYIDKQIGCLQGRNMALPWWNKGIGIDFKDSVNHFDYQEGEDHMPLQKLSAAMIALGACLKDELERFRYVGPIRQAPARNYIPPKSHNESRWACGLGAWDALVRNKALRQEVSTWLGNDNHLDTGYKIDWHSYRELDDDTYNRMRLAAQNNELDDKYLQYAENLPVQQGRLVILDTKKELQLSPCDLGEGISQVVPVVAASLDRNAVTPSGDPTDTGLVAIEQPELHIHPRMQVVLGDLFLSQCKKRQFLIETHSEHIMLRLMRRVRETADNELPIEAPEATLNDVAVYYVEPSNGTAKITKLRISEDGEFKDPWPKGFFAERIKELL